MQYRLSSMSRYGPLGAEKYSARRALYLICIAMTYSRDNCLFRQGSVSTELVAHLICILDRMNRSVTDLSEPRSKLSTLICISTCALARPMLFSSRLCEHKPCTGVTDLSEPSFCKCAISQSVKFWVALKRAGWLCVVGKASLSTESVEGSSLTFQGVDDIEGGDSLSLGVLGVGDSITDDVFQEDFEDTSGLFVDQAGDTLDTTSASQSSDGGLGDSLDVVTKNLSVTLGASLSQSFSALASS